VVSMGAGFLRKAINMTSEWFLNVAGKTYGPYEAGKLRQFVREGRLTPDTLIRKGEEGPWVAHGR